jgi:hypothetical protein
MFMPPKVDPPRETEVYDMYESLRDDVVDEMFEAPDDVQQALEPVCQALTNLLDNEDMIALQANEAKFTVLTPAIKSANDELQKALAGVQAVAGKMNDAAAVIGGITKLLNLADKFA